MTGIRMTERRTRDVEFKERQFQFMFLEDRRQNMDKPRYVVDIYEKSIAGELVGKVDALHILPLSPLSPRHKEGFVYLAQYSRFQTAPCYGKSAEEAYQAALTLLGNAIWYWRKYPRAGYRRIR